MKKVWFITGASQGLGLVLAQQLMEQGYRVAGTSRSQERLTDGLGEKSDRFLPLEVDLLNETSIKNAIDATLSHFGQLDVVVNNAGYGLLGALEEVSDAESRENFDINVFGSLNVIRQALPLMREQRSGHIFNIASVAGVTGRFPGFGIYCATKFAVHGFTEALYEEVKPFGIAATVVSPGYFRTNFLSDSSLAKPKNEIAAYENVRENQMAHEDQYDGNQPGDPVKAAKAMIVTSEATNPTLHLVLGQDAYDMTYQKMEQVQEQLALNKKMATATGF